MELVRAGENVEWRMAGGQFAKGGGRVPGKSVSAGPGMGRQPPGFNPSAAVNSGGGSPSAAKTVRDKFAKDADAASTPERKKFLSDAAEGAAYSARPTLKQSDARAYVQEMDAAGEVGLAHGAAKGAQARWKSDPPRPKLEDFDSPATYSKAYEAYRQESWAVKRALTADDRYNVGPKD